MKLTITAVMILLSALAVSAQNTCGILENGARCADHRCCSKWGYCGDNAAYCGDTCELDCWSGERSDHRCGYAVDNAPCGYLRCCSRSGWCGDNSDYCSAGNCQYRCSSANSGPAIHGNTTLGSVGDVITETVFDNMFPRRKFCPSGLFYSYHAFITAAESFPAFATTGDVAMRKKEVAAFLAVVSQATYSEKMSNVDKADEYGLCHINTTVYENDFCTSSDWPCAPTKKYTPRGAIQLAHNFNYGLAGQALGVDLINNPELVATNPIISFKTAMWFWMTRNGDKPSYHDAVAAADSDATRNDVIGDITMGTSSLGFYKRYCEILGVSHGHDDNPAEISRIRMNVAKGQSISTTKFPLLASVSRYI